MGPLRWDHQKSDEFEATLRLKLGGFLTGGSESNLKFARLLTTPFHGDLIAALGGEGLRYFHIGSQTVNHFFNDFGDRINYRVVLFLYQRTSPRFRDSCEIDDQTSSIKHSSDSLTSTYRSSY